MDEGLVVCRLLHYAAAMLLFGVSAFQNVLAPPALARSLDRGLKPVANSAILTLFVTAMAWLMLAAGTMGDGWSDVWNPQVWSDVLFGTEFGHVWLWQMVLLVVLVLLLARNSNKWTGKFVLSALVLGGLGFIGHAAMQWSAIGVVVRASHVVHLLGAGFWLGSLLPIVLSLTAMKNPALNFDASLALRRFSGLGHVAVAAVIATGALNTLIILGKLPLHPSSPYQFLLLVKIGIVALMICVALVNRYAFVPRLKDDVHALEYLRYGAILEMILGLGVLGLISIIGTLEPV